MYAGMLAHSSCAALDDMEEDKEVIAGHARNVAMRAIGLIRHVNLARRRLSDCTHSHTVVACRVETRRESRGSAQSWRTTLSIFASVRSRHVMHISHSGGHYFNALWCAAGPGTQVCSCTMLGLDWRGDALGQ